MADRPPDIVPANGIEARYWGHFIQERREQAGETYDPSREPFFAVCLRISEVARATRYLGQHDIAELARTIRGYRAMVTLTDHYQGRQIYDLIYINPGRTFIFYSAWNSKRQLWQVSQEEADKLADLFEAYLPDRLKGGEPMTPEAMQAMLDEEYPEDAALREEWQDKVDTERARLAIFDRRHPEVWSAFEKMVLADLKAKKQHGHPIMYQLHARAPSYSARHYAARFVQKHPRYAEQLIGWRDELTFRPKYQTSFDDRAQRRLQRRKYERKLKADWFAWERYQVARFDKQSPEVWPAFRDTVLAAIRQRTELRAHSWYATASSVPAYLNTWFYAARFLTEYPRYRKLLSGVRGWQVEDKYFVPYWDDEVPWFCFPTGRVVSGD